MRRPLISSGSLISGIFLWQTFRLWTSYRGHEHACLTQHINHDHEFEMQDLQHAHELDVHKAFDAREANEIRAAHARLREESFKQSLEDMRLQVDKEWAEYDQQAETKRKQERGAEAVRREDKNTRQRRREERDRESEERKREGLIRGTDMCS